MGTKSVTGLAPEVSKEIQKYPEKIRAGQALVLTHATLKDRSLVYQFRQSLGVLRQSGSGFAVSGTGEEALRNARWLPPPIRFPLVK